MARLSLLAQNGGVHSGRHTIPLTTAWPYTVAGEVQQRKFIGISMAMTTVWVLQVVVGCGQVQEPLEREAEEEEHVHRNCVGGHLKDGRLECRSC